MVKLYIYYYLKVIFETFALQNIDTNEKRKKNLPGYSLALTFVGQSELEEDFIFLLKPYSVQSFIQRKSFLKVEMISVPGINVCVLLAFNCPLKALSAILISFHPLYINYQLKLKQNTANLFFVKLLM